MKPRSLHRRRNRRNAALARLREAEYPGEVRLGEMAHRTQIAHFIFIPFVPFVPFVPPARLCVEWNGTNAPGFGRWVYRNGAQCIIAEQRSTVGKRV